MAIVATQVITRTGLVLNLQSVHVGDQFVPDVQTFLFIKNGDSVSHTITVDTTATAFGEPIANVSLTVLASKQAILGPFSPGEVAEAGGYLADLTYDAVPSTLQIAVLQLQEP